MVGQMGELQHFLPLRHKRATVLRGDHPACAHMRLQGVFFRVRLTVSWDVDATIATSTTVSANSLSVHRAWPGGGSEQLKAMRCASAAPSQSCGWDGRSCFLRSR